MRHHLQYVRDDLELGVPIVGEVPWTHPIAHVHRDVAARGRVEAGDVIWLVRWPRLHGRRLPASLDARIVVDSGVVLPRTVAARFAGLGRVVHPAGPGSTWLPLGDDERLLDGLRRGGGGPLAAPPREGRPFGARLALAARRLGTLAGASGLALDAAVAGDPRPRVFVSYRWDEGREAAARLVVALLAAGLRAWVDVAGVPRRVWDQPDATPWLREGLAWAIAGADHVVAVATPGYAHGGWTAWEAELAGARLRRWEPARGRVTSWVGRFRAELGR